MQNQQQRFTKIVASHESTRDESTGLEWQAVCFPNAMAHAEAKKACADLRLGGHDDWRLPTRAELLTLVDVARYSPAIDTDAFPDTPSEWFWTATDYAASPSGSAWGVSFGGGDSNVGSRGGYGRVRAVRGSSRQFSASLHGAERA